MTGLRLAVLGLVVVLAGCSGGGGARPAPTRTTGPITYPGSVGSPGNRTYDARRLREAVLGPADVSGYERGDHAYDLRGGCLEQIIGFLFGDLGDVTAQEETALVNPDTLGAVQQRMRSYTGDAAQTYFGTADRAITGCQTLVGTDKNGARTEFTVRPLVIPKYGEEMLALRITGSTVNVRGQVVDLVIFRVENVIEKVDDMNTRGVSADHTSQLVQTAVTKLRTAA